MNTFQRCWTPHTKTIKFVKSRANERKRERPLTLVPHKDSNTLEGTRPYCPYWLVAFVSGPVTAVYTYCISKWTEWKGNLLLVSEQHFQLTQPWKHHDSESVPEETAFSEVSPIQWSWWATERWDVEVTCAAAALWRTGTPERGGWAPEADADSPPDALSTKTNSRLYCELVLLRETSSCSIVFHNRTAVHEWLRRVIFTLDVWQVFLVLVHFAAVDGECQTFEQHGPLLKLSISVGEQTQRAALRYSHSGWG